MKFFPQATNIFKNLREELVGWATLYSQFIEFAEIIQTNIACFLKISFIY